MLRPGKAGRNINCTGRRGLGCLKNGIFTKEPENSLEKSRFGRQTRI